MTIKSDGPSSLIEVALHMLSIHDDLLDEDEDADGMDEAFALEIIRREYVSGTCGAFAIALHDHTGFPIIGLNGALHMAVRRPDSMILNFIGTSSLESVAGRYGINIPLVSTWTRDEALDHVFMGYVERHPWDDVTVAEWVMNNLGRWKP